MCEYMLAIPFYKNEHFIDNIVCWVESFGAKNLTKLKFSVLIINDCPESNGGEYLKKVSGQHGFDFIENDENKGYLKTANIAYRIAKNKKSHLVLLNSDTILTENFLYEIDEAFKADNMLAILSVRSNNASVCNLFRESRHVEDRKAINQFLDVHNKFVLYAPQISYSPVVTGFCFAIRDKILRLFDSFDECFGPGYEEENEYCLRVGQRGYRVGIANRAFVFHLNGRSFGFKKDASFIKQHNLKIIREIYPFYNRIMDDHFSSIDYILCTRIADACENSAVMLIDASVLTSDINGSNKLIVCMLKGFASLKIEIDVCANFDAVNAHQLLQIPNLNFVDSPNGFYQYGIMLCQPITDQQLTLVPNHCLVTTCIFQDVIAHDCPQLRADNVYLDYLWSKLTYVYQNIIFISEHSRQQFILKFGEGVADITSILTPASIANGNYTTEEAYSNTVLVFGNNFHHKGIDYAIKELPVNSGYTYYVLGDSCQTARNDIVFMRPGSIDKAYMHQLMGNAIFFVFPSFSEGYGIPILEAVSYNKPIYCRDIPCYREIIATLPENKKSLIRFVESFHDLTKFYVESSPTTNNAPNLFIDDFSSYARCVFDTMSNVSQPKLYSHLKSRLIQKPHIASQTRQYGYLKRFRRMLYPYLGIHSDKPPLIRRLRRSIGIKKRS